MNSIPELLALGADPLRKVKWNLDGHINSAMEIAFDQTFNQPFDTFTNETEKNAERTIQLILGSKAPLPPELIAMMAEKPPVPDSYYYDKSSIPVEDKVKYECNYIGSPLPEVRATLAYNKVRELVAEKGKLAIPKDQPTHDHLDYYWEKESAENLIAKEVLELLRVTWGSKQTRFKILTDKELWKSPEDALAYATLTSKEYNLCYRTELPIPAELFRGLNERDASKHLARYLEKKNDKIPRSPGAA